MPQAEQAVTQAQETPAPLEKKVEVEEPVPPQSIVRPLPVPPEDQDDATQEEMIPPTAESQQQQIAPTVPVTTAYVLRAEVLEPTWLNVTIDEKSTREYLLNPGEQITWKADTQFSLHIGNAAGLRLYLNDKPLKSLGPSGSVVHLQLPDPSMLVTPDSDDPDSVDSP
jgi:hypothetical protein